MRKIKISNVQALDDNFRQECIKEFHIISVHICPHCHNGFVVMHHMKAQKKWIC